MFELEKNGTDPKTETIAGITTFLEHPGFPVDIRHNAKIGRPQLAAWATKVLR